MERLKSLLTQHRAQAPTYAQYGWWQWMMLEFYRTFKRRWGMSFYAVLLILGLCLIWTVLVLIHTQKLADFRKQEKQMIQDTVFKPLSQPKALSPVHRDIALLRFQENLVRMDDIPKVTHDLLELAQKNHSVIKSVQYQTVNDPTAHVMFYKMSLPVEGSYAEVKQFLRQSLMEQPMLMINQLQFKRRSSNDAVVEAQLQWTLVSQTPSPMKLSTQPTPNTSQRP